ncbi:MAG: MutH/Sau3AI family endonuclease [Polyangiaceae bacterium]
MSPLIPAPPRTEPELLRRARALAGHDLGAIARAVGTRIDASPVRTKGSWGALLERALGATAGSRSEPDFAHLGVELKTVPMRASGRAIESTYVCVLDLLDAENARWETSWARRKLARVLFVPILAEDPDWTKRRVGLPVLFSPTPAQDAALGADFDEIMGAFGAGRIEEVTAHWGRYLQVRPKARNGEKTVRATTPDGDEIRTVKKGFYLRARFVEAILVDPAALP